MNKNLYEFKDYRAFFFERIETSRDRWGIKSRLAKAIGCQLPFLSQFFSGVAELSQEQVFRAADFFSLNEEEREYLLLLHRFNRAGAADLKKHIEKKLEKVRSERMVLSKRLGKDHTLSEKEQAIYYSSWIYAAIHMAVAIPDLKTKENLKKVFHVGQKQFSEALKFLVETGLVLESNGLFSLGRTRVRLGNDSPWIVKHHTNWRLRAIENLESENSQDQHYSGVFTLSEEDARKIKDMMLDHLQQKLKLVDQSKEEKLYVLNFDFFELLK